MLLDANNWPSYVRVESSSGVLHETVHDIWVPTIDDDLDKHRTLGHRELT